MSSFVFIHESSKAQCPPTPIIAGPTSVCASSHVYQLLNPDPDINTSYVWSITISNIIYNHSGTSNFNLTNAPWISLAPGARNILHVTASNGTCAVTSNYDIYSCCEIPNITSLNDPTSSSFASNNISNQTIVINGTFNVTTTMYFNFDTILLGPAASIKLNGKSLVLDHTVVQAGCGTMWKGFNLTNFGQLKVYDSRISDAQYAVNINGDGEGELHHGVSFTRNYISIYTDPANSVNSFNGPSTGSTIFRNVTFDGSQPLVTPFPGQTPAPINSTSLAGMVLNNIASFSTSLDIGNALLNNINIRNLNAGIIAINSNIDVHNCLFQNINPAGGYTNSGSGSAVYCASDNFHTQNLNVGLTGNGLMPCTFDRCRVGISAFRNINTAVVGNLFTNIPGINPVNQTGIYIYHKGQASFHLTRTVNIANNVFSYLNTGIRMNDIRRAVTTISQNIIDAFSIAGPTGTIGTFNSCGINIENTGLWASRIKIFGNNIGLNGNTRIGIHMRNCTRFSTNPSVQDIDLYDNFVFYNTPTVPTTHYGVWLENMNYAYLQTKSNGPFQIVNNQAFTGSSTEMRGIMLKDVQNSNIIGISTINLGDGIYVQGHCLGTKFKCNALNNNIIGFDFNSAELSQQGKSNDAWDNVWNNNGNNLYRMNGNLQVPLSWYHQTGAVFDPQAGTGVSVSPPISFNTGSTNSTCYTSMEIGNIENIINDQVTYQEWAESGRYLDKMYAYNELADNSELLASNQSYQSFYSNENTGNLEYLRLIYRNINEGDYTDARSVLENSFTVNNLVEANLQYVLALYVNKSLTETDTFTVAETDSLTNIALFSPSEGGPAVHFARAMLGLEVNDPKLVLRNAMPQLSPNQLSVDLTSDYKESNNVNEADKPLYIIIADLTGKQVARINPNEPINNKITTEGIYFLTTKYASGKEINTKAFIYKK